MKLWDAMMVTLVAGAALLAGAQLVRAAGLETLSETEADSLLTRIVRADVASSTCPGQAMSDADWQMLNRAVTVLSAQMGLDPTAVERSYYGPAFAEVHEAGACARMGADITPVIQDLRGMQD